MKSLFIFIVLLIYSEPTDSQWVLDFNFNNPSISVRSISIVDSNYFWVSTIDSGLYGHLYKKINGNIYNVNLPSQLRPGDILAKDTSRLFLNSTIENRLFYTSNSGDNWIVSIDSTHNGSRIIFAIANDDPDFIVADRTVFVDSVKQYFYKSTNGGLNWQVQLLNLTQDREAYTLSITDKNHIFLGINCFNNCSDLQYIFSTNGGINWAVKQFPSISDNHIIDAPVFKRNNLFGFTFSPGYVYYLFSTTSGGSNWSQPSPFFSGGSSFVERLINIDSTSTWICAASDKIYKTTNDGANWTLMTIPLENDERINTMDIVKRGNRYFGFIGTYFGKVYKLTESINPIGIQPVSNEMPKSYSLSQNYPNPFNPSTKIRFSLQFSGYVKLTVYDALGKEVKLLVNDELRAGIYETDFDASAIPSGVYFYKIETPAFTQTRKMIVIK